MAKIPIKQKTFNPLVKKGFGLIGDQIPMDGTQGDPVRGNVNMSVQPDTLPDWTDLSYVTRGWVNSQIAANDTLAEILANSPGISNITGGTNLVISATDIVDYTHNVISGSTQTIRNLGNNGFVEQLAGGAGAGANSTAWFIQDATAGDFTRGYIGIQSPNNPFGSPGASIGYANTYMEVVSTAVNYLTGGGVMGMLAGLDTAMATGNFEFTGAIIGTRNGNIPTTAQQAVLLGGTTNTIGANILRSAVIGGQNITADKNDYVFVPGLEVRSLLRHDPAATTSKIIEYGDGTIHTAMAQNGGTDNELIIATRGNGNTDASWYGNPSGWIILRGTGHATGSQVLMGSNTSFFYISNENPGTGGAVYNMALGGNENGLRLGGVGAAGMSTANVDITKGVILASRNSLINTGTTVNGAIIGGRSHALNSGSIDSIILGGSSNSTTHPRVAMLGGSNLVNSAVFTADYAVCENLEIQGGNGRVTAGDFEIVNSASGVILNSASFRWRLTVDDTGTLSTTSI